MFIDLSFINKQLIHNRHIKFNKNWSNINNFDLRIFSFGYWLIVYYQQLFIHKYKFIR